MRTTTEETLTCGHTLTTTWMQHRSLEWITSLDPEIGAELFCGQCQEWQLIMAVNHNQVPAA